MAERASALQSKVGVLLVDGQEVVRTGLRHVLESTGCYEILGEAGTAAEATESILRLRPAVVVIESQLEDGSAASVCEKVRRTDESVRFLVLTSVRDEETFLRIVSRCACSYVLKQASNREILDDVARVASGQAVVDPTLTGHLLARVRGEGKQADGLTQLSEREHRLLVLVAQGWTNKEIAGELQLAEKTVKNSLSVLFRKLGVDRRAQAAVIASQLLDPADQASRPRLGRTG